MPNPKGAYCPSCRGVRLAVVKVLRVCPGRTVRFRRCTACGHRVKFVETQITRPSQPEPG